MNGHLQFDFLVDKPSHTFTIRRAFQTGKQLVWDCYTKSELLDQWFAPGPLTAKTKSMDFRAGGHWHYVMTEPNGTEYWGWTDYLEVQPIDSYRSEDSFCDAEGKINEDLPVARMNTTFHEKQDHTLVEVIVTYASLEALETVIQMGLQQGLSMTLDKLDQLLSKLNQYK